MKQWLFLFVSVTLVLPLAAGREEASAISVDAELLVAAQELMNTGRPAYRILDLERDAREELAEGLLLRADQRAALDAVLADYTAARDVLRDDLIDSLLWEQSVRQTGSVSHTDIDGLFEERDYLRAAFAEVRADAFDAVLNLLDSAQTALLLPENDDAAEPPFDPRTLPLGEAPEASKRANWCTEHIMIIGADSRYVRDTCTKYTAPWQNVGRLSIGCSGTLIGSRHVLTAAHCLIDGAGNFKGHTQITFALGRFNNATQNYQTPFGTYYVKRAIVPSEYATTNDPVDRSFEYALLELGEPIPGATPMDFGYINWATVSAKSAFTVGYPGASSGTFANLPLVGGAGSPLQDNAERWLNGGDSGLLVHSLDVEGGQSGSAVYVFDNGVRKLIGVMVGSPISECQAGRVWASRITTGAEDRIRAWMANFNNNTWPAKRKTYNLLNTYAPNAPSCNVIIVWGKNATGAEVDAGHTADMGFNTQH